VIVEVFPEPDVPRDAPLDMAEPPVNFYVESTRHEAIAARAWFNGAFAGRLRSADDVHHASAVAQSAAPHRCRAGVGRS
jgi:hypothetical protein